MALRGITANDWGSLDWIESEEGGWRIVADLTCRRCGAYQAADSDPTFDKAKAVELTVRLFNSVGWRVDDRQRVLCPECVKGEAAGA